MWSTGMFNRELVMLGQGKGSYPLVALVATGRLD